eukprot:5289786-Amphidinium_carterae.1
MKLKGKWATACTALATTLHLLSSQEGYKPLRDGSHHNELKEMEKKGHDMVLESEFWSSCLTTAVLKPKMLQSKTESDKDFCARVFSEVVEKHLDKVVSLTQKIQKAATVLGITWRFFLQMSFRIPQMSHLPSLSNLLLTAKKSTFENIISPSLSITTSNMAADIVGMVAISVAMHASRQ